MRLTRSELIQRLVGGQDDFSADNVVATMKAMLDQMRETLARGERIEIRGFGSFSLHHRPPRLARHPQTGEPVQAAATGKPHFKPGQALRERVNAARQGELG